MNATVAIFTNVGTVPQSDYMNLVIENNISITWIELANTSSTFIYRKLKEKQIENEIEQALKS